MNLPRLALTTIALLVVVSSTPPSFAEDAKLLASGNDSSVWKSGSSDRNKITVGVDKRETYNDQSSTKISFDLNPGQDGQWYFCNIPLIPPLNDWTRVKAISCAIKGDGSSNKIRLAIKDGEGEILEQTEPISLTNTGWTVIVATLDDGQTGFKANRYHQPNKDKIVNAGVIDKGGVEELQITVDDTWLDGRKGSFWISSVKLVY